VRADRGYDDEAYHGPRGRRFQMCKVINCIILRQCVRDKKRAEAGDVEDSGYEVPELDQHAAHREIDHHERVGH